ncbi:MAG: ECF-type sigma factor [Pyrinomonadaceae bacterium]
MDGKSPQYREAEGFDSLSKPDPNTTVFAVKQQDLDNFIPKAYAELRRLAAYHLRFERPDHTLCPTALVHEAYLRLKDQYSLNLDDRPAFFTAASSMMRRILVNHAKRRNRLKRGAGIEKITLDEGPGQTLLSMEQKSLDVIALEEALKNLAKLDQRQVSIVELHFFGGLTFDEIAGILNISLSTVQREWRMARNWLYLQVGATSPEEA